LRRPLVGFSVHAEFIDPTFPRKSRAVAFLRNGRCEVSSDSSVRICLYLIALNGARLHFCGARRELAPPAATELQRHCLAPGHADCPVLRRLLKTGRLVSRWEYLVETEDAARKTGPTQQADVTEN
jgi:hypothetical protein